MKLTDILCSRGFIAAFLIGYFGFFVLTIGILEVQGPGFAAGWVEYGFPFTYYISTCFGGDYISMGLLGNVLFAVILSGVTSLIINVIWCNVIKRSIDSFDSDAFRKKWYLG
ncbi:MAG: hypothetical protein HKN33_16355 [Pyrinomonadaceae bacterium]|nr:hypothetical protein [Pyrinomonadaceae bacterium]